MRFFPTMLITAAVLFPCESATAQESDSKTPTRRQRLLKRFDADDDGKLSQNERQAARKQLGLSRRNPNAPKPKRMTWTVLGEERKAWVYLPEKESKSGSPVVFGFHGHGGNARNVARRFGFQRHWPEAVVVYMQGLPTPGRLTDPEGKRNGWQHTGDEKNGRDLKFFDAVLKTLHENHDIDENRIYTTGHSNGGGFTYLLWCERPGVFAAIAPSAAGSRSLRKTTPKPVPVMHLAGRNDKLVKFRWQQLTMRKVRQINNCNSEGKAWTKNATLYPSKDGAPFVSYIHEGTHRYPIEAPALIVRFFKEHKRKPEKSANE